MRLNRFFYYIFSFLFFLIPPALLRWYCRNRLAEQNLHNTYYIMKRVNYYNKLRSTFTVDTHMTMVEKYRQTGGSAYYIDLYKVIKCFPDSFRFHYINGDVVDVPEVPSFLKSRPISDTNSHSVLLKLNRVRHYNFIRDKIRFQDKKPMAVWRGDGFRQNRRDLVRKFKDHPWLDVARVDIKKASVDDDISHFARKMTVSEQLNYKFIISLEGKDVATNLKWIMSSNSVCIMPKPKYETWFMEGKLKAGVHYIEVKDDYSDLLQKMNYYLEHEEEALDIIANANSWVEQFKFPRRERLISLLVAQKYFEKSGQWDDVLISEPTLKSLLAGQFCKLLYVINI
ncbi:lipopolysaccharide A protein [Vibrio sp. HA2012]|uniref:glycosyl transferase family 90 n=1 Tax=Vibrio sp. HA2012 TaxID=1971595 RepID=UPI000C2BDA29|nr:glycosyl transferase family 90 [Vibrio sp. HA2012]PJC86877.1 lipopolysaccharide A protein [Vibrio sp. HA2012]